MLSRGINVRRTSTPLTFIPVPESVLSDGKAAKKTLDHEYLPSAVPQLRFISYLSSESDTRESSLPIARNKRRIDPPLKTDRSDESFSRPCTDNPSARSFARDHLFPMCVCVCVCVLINIQQLYLSFLSARHSSFAVRENFPIELFTNRCEPAIPFSINSAELRVYTWSRRYGRLLRDFALLLIVVTTSEGRVGVSVRSQDHEVIARDR